MGTLLGAGMAMAHGWLSLGGQGRSQEREKTSSTSQQFLLPKEASLLETIFCINSPFLLFPQTQTKIISWA